MPHNRPTPPQSFLCVHQGYELYGSDRTFISSLQALRACYPEADVIAVLPRDGELAKALSDLGCSVIIEPIWVLRKAFGVLRSLASFLALPFYVLRALRRMRNHSLVYINTSVVLDYTLATRLSSVPAILHIHEIPTGFALRFIRTIVMMARALIVYNSHATKTTFDLPGSRLQFVLHNGIVPPVSAGESPAFPPDLRRRHVLMIGRINAWKGQGLVMEALQALPVALAERLEIKFAGAAFEDGPDAERLAQMVKEADPSLRITLEGFVKDPSQLYQWADIVLVPSTKPEPFGLVAIEAMSHGRPVIAANNGGLKEIVAHEQTGLLFEPGNAVALGDALRWSLKNEERMKLFGANGRAVFMKSFTEQQYQDNFVKLVCKTLMNASEAHARA